MQKPHLTKSGKSSKNCQHGALPESGAKKRSSKRHRRRTVHFATLMYVPLQEVGVGAEVSKIQRTCCTPGGRCERPFWLLRCIYGGRFVSLTNEGRLHPSQNGGCCSIAETPSVSVQTSGYVYHDTSGPNHGPTLKNRQFFLGEIFMVTHLQLQASCVGDKLKKSSVLTGTGKSTEFGMIIRASSARSIPEGTKNFNPVVENLMTLVDLGEPTSSLDHVYLGCTQRECPIERRYHRRMQKLFELRISAGATEKLLSWEKSTRKLSLGFVTWKDTRRNA